MFWFNVETTVYRAVQYVYTCIAFFMLCGITRHLVQQCCSEKDISCCTAGSKHDLQGKRSTRTKSKRCQASQKTRNYPNLSRKSSRRRIGSHRQKLNAQLASQAMIWLSLISSVLVLTHILLDLWVFAVKNRSTVNLLCIRQAMSGIIYFLCALCVYLFLWIRQRVFYTHPVLRHLLGPTLNRFSWSVLVTIVASMITFTVLYTIPHLQPEWFTQSSHSSLTDEILSTGIPPNGNLTIIFNDPKNSTASDFLQRSFICSFKRKRVFLWVHFVVTLLFLYFQTALQFLFAYPIIYQRLKYPKASKHKGDGRETAESSLDKKCSKDDNVYLRASLQIDKCCQRATVSTTDDSNNSDSCVEATPLNDEQQLYSCGMSTKKRFALNIVRAASDPCLPADHRKPCNDVKVKALNCSSNDGTKRLTSCGQKSQKIKNNESQIDNTSPVNETLLARNIENCDYMKRSEMQDGATKAALDGEILKEKSDVNKTKHLSFITGIRSNLTSGKCRSFDSNLNKSLSKREKLKSVSQISTKRKRPHERLRSYVVRCFAMSLICCTSDLAAFGFSLYTQLSANKFYMDGFTGDFRHEGETHEYGHFVSLFEETVTVSLLSALAYNGNMIINLFCLILCYDDWSSMLFPCCVRSKSAERRKSSQM